MSLLRVATSTLFASVVEELVVEELELVVEELL
jgi:hypothetical protein